MKYLCFASLLSMKHIFILAEIHWLQLRKIQLNATAYLLFLPLPFSVSLLLIPASL
jgi:hypothetical protein